MNEEPPSATAAARSRRAAVLCAAVPVAALLAAWILPLASGSRTLYLRDVLNTHYAMKASHAAALRAGEWLPLIDPARAGGQPLLGNPNVVPWYPDDLLYLVASPLWALNAHLWLHLVVALAAAYVLGRALGLGRGASGAAAVTYALCGFTLSNLNFYNLMAGVALTPAFVAAVVHSARAPRRMLPAVAGGALWALLLLGGEPLLAVMALVLAGLACACAPPGARLPGRALGLALGCGSLLAAPQLVELWRILPTSLRGMRGYGADGGVVGSLHPRQALDWWLPFASGRVDLLLQGAFWGGALYGGKPPIFLSLFPGVLGFVLVGASCGAPPAGVEADGYRRWRRWAWVAVALGVALALGAANPLARPLFRLGPLRYPVKFLLLAVPGLAILAGLGWQRTLAAGTRLRLGLWLAAGAYGGVWMILTVLPAASERWLRALVPATLADDFVRGERLRWAGTCFLTLVVTLALLAVERAGREPRRRWLRGLLLGVHVAGQMLLLRPLLATDEARFYRAPEALLAAVPAASTLVHGDFLDLFGRSTLADAPLAEPTLRSLERRAFARLYPAAGVAAGRRYELDPSPEGLDAYLTRAAQAAVERLPDAARLRLLRTWSVEHLLLGRALAPEAMADVAAVHRIELEGGPLDDLVLRDPAPPVRFVANVVRAPDLQVALATLLRDDHDFRTTAVVAGPGTALTGSGGTARVRSEARERVEVDVDAPSPGVVVFARAHLSLYRATLDGAPAPVVIADLCRVGVEVPAGVHRLVLATDRRPTRVAAALAGLGLLGLVALALSRRAAEGR